MKKIGFVSLGCPKNLVDAEVMMGLVKDRGLQLTPNRDEAEIIVVNTCGFIDPAKEESLDTILEMAHMKKAGRCQKLVVTGCLVERYRDVLAERIPEIDALLGTNQIEDILTVCEENPEPPAPSGGAMEYLYDHTTPRLLSTPRHTAYLKIAEGCDHTCDFCIIPKLRGRFRSRTLDSILSEAESLARQGVRELILVGQDTTHYGRDLGLRHGLARLLKRLAGTEGIGWIRFLYGYPHHVTDELIDVIGSEERLCKYFDIPFQHASERLLRRMQRGGSGATIGQLIKRIRQRIPDAALRTSFIVGYPGETEAEFQELLDLVRRVEFDHLGVFTYSDEEGTPAYNHVDKVSQRTARARRRALMKEQEQISRRKNQRLVGQQVRVLLEGYAEETDLLLQARMQSQAPEIDGCVLINEVPEDCHLEPGQFLTVEVTRAFDHDLLGRVI